MKKTISLIIIAMLLLASLAGCGKKDDQADAAPAVSADTAAAPAEDDAAAGDRFVGQWQLDEANDLEDLDYLFPSAALFGGGMEIRADGMISWYIGSDGAVGSYEIQGKYLVTDVVDELDGETHHVAMGFQGDKLIMSFKDVKLVWIPGDDAPQDEG